MVTKLRKDFKSSTHQKKFFKKRKNLKNRRQNNQYD